MYSATCGIMAIDEASILSQLFDAINKLRCFRSFSTKDST